MNSCAPTRYLSQLNPSHISVSGILFSTISSSWSISLPRHIDYQSSGTFQGDSFTVPWQMEVLQLSFMIKFANVFVLFCYMMLFSVFCTNVWEST